ncbi:hypothetical protein E5673_01170 [Sphingomonas sp. PAMC26645]|uniref:hypothetical protein n=1 Tax=Sphingomonas sp. PAMC26645 TaxID=2565555 RepID=UPI00109DE1BE|nr:hypothetical protein [Sphingomonas sp. PAMC26645]QCB41007.1 hypothetical protein E5673_01170 [Sphingomonas sp. PAMC26645]
MPKLNRKQIQEQAIAVLQGAHGGIRWSELLKAVVQTSPETPQNSIHGGIHNLLKTDGRIEKIAKGTYRWAELSDAGDSAAIAQDEAVAQTPVQVETADHTLVTYVEADFYQSFADWLVDVAEEVNAAVALGGSVLRGKWGTPDVIGVLKPRTQDMLKFEPQIVSAEIKIDPNQPVVAFGQAVAYRLFSHKSYIVVPSTTGEDDMGRLKALCSIHGVGLVTFTLDKAAPDYTTLVLPQQASPDMFYANQMLRRLLAAEPTAFERLF